MKKLYLVKLGGSLITDKTKPYTERREIIKRLCREAAYARRRGVKLILGHGGGSYPHTSAKLYRTAEGIVNKRSAYGLGVVHYDASELNRIIMKSLLDLKVPALSLQPSAFAYCKNGRIRKVFLDPLLKALELGVLPVVYGDIGLDSAKGCCIMSTERILAKLAIKLRKYYEIRMVMCGIVDGVYTADPLKSKDAKFIGLINRKNIKEVESYLSGSHGIDVTGGMLHKVRMLYKLAKYGIKSYLINGNKPGLLRKVLMGRRVRGTIIEY